MVVNTRVLCCTDGSIIMPYELSELGHWSSIQVDYFEDWKEIQFMLESVVVLLMPFTFMLISRDSKQS